MKESKAIARKLVAQSIKPLVDEVEEEVRRKGTSEDRALLAEVHALMNQLLGESAADETQKSAKGAKRKAGSQVARRSHDQATVGKNHIKKLTR